MTAPSRFRSRQAQDYLAAVEHELADLPSDDRSALLEDLAHHLDALAAEGDDRDIAVRLGPPATYGADLRAAAGLPARGDRPRPATAGLRKRLDDLLATPVGRRVVPAARQVWRLLGELRPAWWVLRGYLVVLVPCLYELDGVSDFPVPAPAGSHLLGALLVLAVVGGSVALGRRRPPRPVGMLVAALGVAIAFSSFVAWDRSGVSRGTTVGAFVLPPEQAVGTYPLLSRFGPVTDVLPYAADGTPLEDVLLYDQDGRPLQVGLQEWWADECVRALEQPLAADGVPVPNSFPQSYELIGLDVDINSVPVTPGQCETEPSRPDVPLPTFPHPTSGD